MNAPSSLHSGCEILEQETWGISPKLSESRGWEESSDSGRGSSPGSLRSLAPRGKPPPSSRLLGPSPHSLPLPPALSLPPPPPVQLSLQPPSKPLSLPSRGSRTRSGEPPRPWRCCCWAPERETKLKLIVLLQLPSQARDTDLYSRRPRLPPYPAWSSSLGASSTSRAQPPPAGLQGSGARAASAAGVTEVGLSV